MTHVQLHSHVSQLPLPSWLQEKKRKKKRILLLLFYKKGQDKEFQVTVPNR